MALAWRLGSLILVVASHLLIQPYCAKWGCLKWYVTAMPCVLREATAVQTLNISTISKCFRIVFQVRMIALLFYAHKLNMDSPFPQTVHFSLC